ncbi:uncharacterized protein BDR25DRAFT_382021 [Lindgomyces ingoldianus]|uniref:Uncharacterized protein n=1 Tax=Lindgomyces ingoldianus TaxID=673940 RepID=A0ACB6R7X4_9PLEO|nr:uncharacterized protein BDR25DRAFT_382021 [Lindgomyces ingoldianus]KAF2475187.1 hypothetical protein BDR25DRAFT_382021 [Lindgomyces ingoldianus]
MIITEEPCLHLVWIHNRIFIKPLLRYLLSHEFWELYLSEDSNRLGDCRTIHHVNVSQSKQYLQSFNKISVDILTPRLTLASFGLFTLVLGQIKDLDVLGGYGFGELRLTQLNFHAPLFLCKFHFEQVYGQYGVSCGRLYRLYSFYSL